MRRLKPHVHRWLWIGCVGFGFIAVAVMLVLLNLNDHTTAKESLFVGSDPNAVASPLPVTEPLLAVEQQLELPKLDFPIGSVEEACGLNEFPTFWVDEGLKTHYGHSIEILESNGACRATLEAYMSSVNPYLWGESEARFQVVDTFAFVVLDEPLTFGRIFADPNGDLIRVQDALLRPECLLKGDETNWELKETCHADAFLNYALLNRFCFDKGIHYRDKTRIYPEDNPTPEQDRFMWKQSLEDDWVRMKCKELGPTLELTSEQNPVLYKLVMSLDPSDRKKDSRELLIELAARLGDNAAGITEGFVASFGKHSYNEKGKKYGRLSWLLTSDHWREFTYKGPPSVDRFIQVFRMLALASARRPDPRDEFQFDWELVAQHLCARPFYFGYRKSAHEAEIRYLELNPLDGPADIFAEELRVIRETYENPKSCQEIVHAIRQRDNTNALVLTALDKFEQVAIKLDVYE